MLNLCNIEKAIKQWVKRTTYVLPRYTKQIRYIVTLSVASALTHHLWHLARVFQYVQNTIIIILRYYGTLEVITKLLFLFGHWPLGTEGTLSIYLPSEISLWKHILTLLGKNYYFSTHIVSLLLIIHGLFVDMAELFLGGNWSFLV